MRKSFERIRGELHFWNNNRVLAIVPTRFGRLYRLFTFTSDDEEKPWVFSDPRTWIDPETGDEMVDHHHRGVMNGTLQEGKDFLEMCRQLGIDVREASLDVPFSNGQKRRGRFYAGKFYHRGEFRQGSDKGFNDFPRDELRRVRLDLPSHRPD